MPALWRSLAPAQFLPVEVPMCSVDKQPSPSDFMANLRQPMPLGKKVRLVARNLAVRIRKRSDCCGHAGEPGC